MHFAIEINFPLSIQSALVFGPAGGRHFYTESREMEDYTSRIEEEPAAFLELAPRVRTYRERQRQTPIQEHNAAKEEARLAYLEGEASQLLQAATELKALKETREAEPELGEAYQKARKQLQEQGIDFLPLYEATEFRPTVTAGMRERLESALLEAGLLNALILKKNETAATLPEDGRNCCGPRSSAAIPAGRKRA